MNLYRVFFSANLSTHVNGWVVKNNPRIRALDVPGS